MSNLEKKVKLYILGIVDYQIASIKAVRVKRLNCLVVPEKRAKLVEKYGLIMHDSTANYKCF